MNQNGQRPTRSSQTLLLQERPAWQGRVVSLQEPPKTTPLEVWPQDAPDVMLMLQTQGSETPP